MSGGRLGRCCVCDDQRGSAVGGCRMIFEGVERLPERGGRQVREPERFLLEGPLCQTCTNLLYKRLKGVVGRAPFRRLALAS